MPERTDLLTVGIIAFLSRKGVPLRRNTLVRRYDVTWGTPSARKSFTVVRVSRKRGCSP